MTTANFEHYPEECAEMKFTLMMMASALECNQKRDDRDREINPLFIVCMKGFFSFEKR